MKKFFTIASLAALIFASCNRESAQSGATGEGSVAIRCGVTTVADVTRAELTTEVSCTTPSVEDFALTIEGVSLNYNEQYATIAEFNEENYLYKGDYKATVTAGDITVEGYDKATFVGTEPFSVFPRQETEVQITATIANALVMVEVTDNFKSYFPGGYELELKTAAGNKFNVSAQKDLIFIAPTSFTINGTAIKQANQSGSTAPTVQLPEFKRENLQPRTIYTVKFDVSTVGKATIEITLNETLVETVVIEEELNEFA